MIDIDRHPIEVIIDAGTWANLEKLAQARNSAKLATSTKRFANQHSDVDLHLFGLASEWAFGWLMGLPPAQDASTQGDQGHDFTLPSGLTVDVKYRHGQRRDFAINGTDPARHFRADIGALMWQGQRPRAITFVGWIERDQFLRDAQRVMLKSWRLLLKWQHLRPPQELIALARKADTVL